jgi:hypothetical protein
LVLPLLFSITLFVSAALLFCVQPMTAKLLLPKLGGSPAVWNTCMVFFQVILLAGYTYAHILTARFSQRRQVLIHAVLLLLPLAVLPICLPAEAVSNLPHDTSPLPWLLGVLFTTVGLPFFAVATSGPLLQKWFANTEHPSAADPYFLYAASNLGSMLGLLGYPAGMEPLLTLVQQGWFWAFAYGVLVVLTLGCAAAAWRSSRGFSAVGARGATARKQASREASSRIHVLALAAAQVGGENVGQGSWPEPITLEECDPVVPAEPSGPPGPTIGRRLRWVVYAFVPSSMMLGITSYLTTDIAAIPLLWVIPSPSTS